MDITAYAHALAAVAVYALLVMVLAPLSTRSRTPEARAECGKPKRNYENQWYRTERAFANAVENGTPFLGSVVVAILVGAAPFWVNLLASIAIVGRLAMAFVHIKTTNQSLRSACFGLTFVPTFGLALLGLIGAFTL